METLQSFKIGNMTYTLKNNNRVYVKGIGAYKTTKDNETIYLNPDIETEIELCIKNMSFDEHNKLISLYDTREQGYDIFVYNDPVSSTVSFLKSKTAQQITVGVILAGFVIGTYNIF